MGNTPEKSSKNSKNSKNNNSAKDQNISNEENNKDDKNSKSDKKSKGDKKGGAGKNNNSNKPTNNSSKDSESKTSVHNTDSDKLIPAENSGSAANEKLDDSLDKKFSSVSFAEEKNNHNNFNVSEAYDDFKKNNGRVNYMNIKNAKKSQEELKLKMHDCAEKLNSLVDEIKEDERDVQKFIQDSPKKVGVQENGSTIITEEQCFIRQRLAERKNKYVGLKKVYDDLVADEIKIEKELESFRKQLLIEFAEEYPHQDVLKLVNLEELSDGRANESNQPPFTISQQKEQDDPSFNAWQGARTEIYNNRLNVSG